MLTPENQIVSYNEIETTHLKLCRPKESDAIILRNLWRNEEVRKYLGGIISENLIDKKIESLNEHWNKYHFGQWAIRKKSTKQLIGICGLHHSENAANGIEISYMLFPAFWGQGLAKEAAFACIVHGFSILKLEQIIAITQEANLNSCRLLENIGMQHIKNLIQYDAEQRLYSITQNEWLIKMTK